MKHVLPSKFFSLFILVCGLLGARSSSSQSIDLSFGNAEVYRRGVVYQALEQTDGKRVLAGEFLKANGEQINGLVRFNANQTPDVVFNTNVAGNDWAPRHIWEMPNGKLIVVNIRQAMTVGGVPRNTVARLNADGTLDSTFDAGTGTTGTVYCGAVQPDGKLLLGGSFAQFNGLAAAGLIRLNTDGTRDASFSGISGANQSFTVNAIAVVPGSGQILVGIGDGTINGVLQKGLLKLNPNGTVDNAFASALANNSRVYAIALQPDGKMLALNVRVGAGNALVRLLSTGAIDPNYTTTSGMGAVTSKGSLIQGQESIALQPDGKIIVASEAFRFSSSIGVWRTVSRFTSTGQLDSNFETEVSGAVFSVQVLASGNVLLGGVHLFDSSLPPSSSVTDEGVVELTATGAYDLSHSYELWRAGDVYAMALQPDGKVLVGGDIKQVNGVAVSNIARLLPNGTIDASFSCTPNSYVDAITLLPNGQILIGGWFASVNGVIRRGIARLNPTGQVDASFTSPFGPTDYLTYHIVVEPGGTLLLQGRYIVGPQAQSLVRLTTTGQIASGFSVPDAAINNMVVQPDGRILVSGSLTDTGTRYLLYRLLANGSPDPSFTLTPVPSNSNVPYALALQPDGKILLGGYMRSFGSQNIGGFIRLLPDGTPDGSFNAGVPQPMQGYQVDYITTHPNGQVLTCGTTSWQGSTPMYPIAVYDQNGAPSAALNQAKLPNGMVLSAAFQPDGQLLVAGNFSKADGQPRSSVARFSMAGVLSAASAQAQPTTEVYPNPAHGTLQVRVDASARPSRLALLDVTGRVVRTQRVTQPQLTLDVRHLPAGVYLLRVDYADGPVTRRVVVQ